MLSLKLIETENGIGLELTPGYVVSLNRDDVFVLDVNDTEKDDRATTVGLRTPWRKIYRDLLSAYDPVSLEQGDLYIFYKFLNMACVCGEFRRDLLFGTHAAKTAIVDKFCDFMAEHDVHIRTGINELIELSGINAVINGSIASDGSKASMLICEDKTRNEDVLFATIDATGYLRILVQYNGFDDVTLNMTLPFDLDCCLPESKSFIIDKVPEESDPDLMAADAIACMLSVTGLHVNSDHIFSNAILRDLDSGYLHEGKTIIHDFNDLLIMLREKMDTGMISKFTRTRLGKVYSDEYGAVLSFNCRNNSGNNIGMSFDGCNFVLLPKDNRYKVPVTGDYPYKDFQSEDSNSVLTHVLWLQFLYTCSLHEKLYKWIRRTDEHFDNLARLFIAFVQECGYDVNMDYTALTQCIDSVDTVIHKGVVQDCTHQFVLVDIDSSCEHAAVQLTSDGEVHVYVCKQPDETDNKAITDHYCLSLGFDIPNGIDATIADSREDRALLSYFITVGILAYAGISIRAKHFGNLLYDDVQGMLLFNKDMNGNDWEHLHSAVDVYTWISGITK